MTAVLSPLAKQQNPTKEAATDRKRQRTKEWLSKNREWRRAYDRAYRLKHLEKYREKERKRYYKDVNKSRERKRLSLLKNPSTRRKYMGYPEPTRPMPNACELCGRSRGEKALHLDHCHETGRFRGWLCGPCNWGLGHFRDSPDLMRKAIDYVGNAK